MLPASNDGAPRPRRLLCATLFLLLAPGAVTAQGPRTDVPTPPAVVKAAEAETGQVLLMVGRSSVLDVGVPIARVSLTRPEIADAIATSSQQLLIHGKAAGVITMFVWDRSGGIKRYEVTVLRDLGEIATQMQQLFPGEPIKVTGNGRDLVLSGTVSSKYVMEKAADVASGYVEKKENIVNLLRQADSAQSNQVLLRVRFAEVSRSALTELGASLFTSALGFKNYTARTTTEQFPAPTFDDNSGKLIFSDFLNLFLFNNKEGLGTVIHALQNKGAFQSLAEPNLVAESGKEASFLAGGEYPYPAVQGNGASLAVTIVFKEFGIRLTFTPTILGPDTIHLKVRPEVSSLDFTNAINYQGFRIPSLSTRRAETEVELQNGQTFAIAGLMNNTMNSSLQKIPGIGDVPILGLLFRSKAAQKNQSELVVMITPQIMPRNSTGAAERLPGQVEPYLGAPARTIPPPPPYVGPPKQQEPAPAPVASPRAAIEPRTEDTKVNAAPARRENTPLATTTAPTTVSEPARVAVVTPPPAAAKSQMVVQATSPAPTAQAAPVPTASAATAAPPSAATVTPAAPKPDVKALERARKEQQKRQEAEARALARQQEEEKQRKEEQARVLAQKQQDEARLKAAEDARAAEQAKNDARVASEQAKKDAKAAAERAKLEKAKADEERRQQEKLAREQAKRDAEAAKRDAEAAKRQAEFERKQARDLRDAEGRLKSAQAAFEAAQQKQKTKQESQK